jgi:hypothetical protein
VLHEGFPVARAAELLTSRAAKPEFGV